MAYVAGDYRFTVQGTLGSGEQWINRWAVRDVVGPTERGEVVSALHAMYTDIYLLHISSSAKAVSCQSKNLFTDTVTEEAWEDITGDDLSTLLPTQCAIRASLNSQTGVNGGPFIAGWSDNAVATGGLLEVADQTGLLAAVSGFADALLADDMTLCIERPTTEELVTADRARVGLRFDVIRKRANDLAESYAVADLTP